MKDFSRLADALRTKARNEITKKINGSLPEALQINPEDLGGEDDGDDEDDDDDGDDEVSDGSSWCFEYPDAERNLSTAAAAYRVLGTSDDVVAVYDDGRAYFGRIEDLQEYNDTHNLDPDKWDVYEDPDEILALDYDRNELMRVIRMAEEQEESYEDAKKQYEDFHWGDESKTMSVKDIPGVAGPLVLLGIGRRIEYGAKKEGKWEEYYHLFGEESGTYPSVYALGPADKNGHYRTLVINGGGMHVEDRGIVD